MNRRIAAIALSLLWPLATLPAAVAPCLAADAPKSEVPAVFTADEVTFDREHSIVTARGNVEVSQEGRTMLADSISYNQQTDIITATGAVSIHEPTGEVIFARHMEVTGNLRDGIVQSLRMILQDGARMAANGGRRSGGEVLELSKAVYSPCRPCEEDPTRAPLWQVKAARVIHDKTEKVISYRHATLELGGIPIAYTPYLRHPDPTVRRQSGFLAPSIGSSTYLGFVAQAPYYLVMGDNADLTLTPTYTSKQGPVLSGEYRGRFTSAKLDGEASVTHDASNEIHGHIKSEFKKDLNRTWRGGIDLHRTTADTYQRRYGFASPPVLKSRVYAEGFRKRNYANVSGYAFQGLRSTDDPGNTPLVLPLSEYHHVGEADRLGGRTSLDLGFVALTRTDGTDDRRATAKMGWDLPYIGHLGDVWNLSTSLRGDLYHFNGLYDPGQDRNISGFSGRAVPEAALSWRYPMIRSGRNIHELVEPIVSAVVSPYGGNPSDIPNEDSVDFELDDTNLFSSSRFTGLDRIESGPRINYGVRWGVYGNGGGSTSLLVGQSARLKKDDTFAANSGLEDHLSDIVGRLRVSPMKYLDLFYRTRLDKDDFSPARNEVSLLAGVPALRVNLSYLFFEHHEGQEFSTREELSTGIRSQLTKYWRTELSTANDLADGGDLRALGLSFTYEDECLVFSTDLQRSFYEDRDLRPSDSIMLRLNFKTLGEIRGQAL